MKNLRLCVITCPLPKIKGAHVLVSNFLKILEPLSDKIFLITGNYPKNDKTISKKIIIENVKSDIKKEMILVRIFKYILMQSRLSLNLIKISKNVKIVVFFVGGSALLLPMLSAKILRKKVILVATGSASIVAKKYYNNRFSGVGGFIIPYIIEILEKVNFNLTDRIIVMSNSLISYLRLSKYLYKINFNCATSIDTDKFKIKTAVKQRKNLIGYIGRISEEKGIRNFIRAIPLIPLKYEARFLIGGDGPLLNEVKGEVKTRGLSNRVIFAGWISHEVLPTYLNKLKLLVVPSYTEVFATVALEAMACGTPVLTTCVGATPDIVKDGKNGFILENNSPGCIAKNIERVLEHPSLDKIVNNARELVEKNFSYQAVVNGYKKIFEECMEES